MTKKFAIITGASSGIGLATAKLFIENNWIVISVSRQICNIDNVINVQTDLSDSVSLANLQNKLNEIIVKSSVICMVHNAAFYQKDSILNLTSSALRQALEVNVVSPIYLNQLLIPHMRAGSSIIYIGSTLSEKAVKNAASYAVSKHASVGMMRATCQDLAGMHIHTVCICPGFTDTIMLRKHLNNDEAIISQISDKGCFNRLIVPSEIADVILFSAEHPVANGSILHANLGQIES